MTKDKILKDKAALLYVLEKCEGLDIFRTFKILYFASRSHLAKFGRPIIYDDFCALPNGPVPSLIYDAIKQSRGEEVKFHKQDDINIISGSIFAEESGSVIYAKESPDLSRLSQSDTLEINNSIVENFQIPYAQLSQKSHDEAWEKAQNQRKSSPMDILLMAKSAGANDDMLEYIKEHIEMESIIS